MWMAKNINHFSSNIVTCAEMGEEYPVGAFEYRELPFCGTYGIFSKPVQGENLAVISTGSGDVCIGAITEQNQIPKIEAGEILLKADSGATIKLSADGSITLNGLKINAAGQIV